MTPCPFGWIVRFFLPARYSKSAAAFMACIRPALQDEADLLHDGLDFGIFSIEVRRDPDTTAWAVVQQKFSRDQLLRDLRPVRHVHHNHPTPLFCLKRRVDPPPLRLSKLDKARGLPHRLLADSLHADLIDDLI